MASGSRVPGMMLSLQGDARQQQPQLQLQPPPPAAAPMIGSGVVDWLGFSRGAVVKGEAASGSFQLQPLLDGRVDFKPLQSQNPLEGEKFWIFSAPKST